jgi:hypothetical protein
MKESSHGRQFLYDFEIFVDSPSGCLALAKTRRVRNHQPMSAWLFAFFKMARFAHGSLCPISRAMG